MIPSPLRALGLAVVLAAQASLVLAAGTGPTNPNYDENSQAPITPGMSPGTTPSGAPPGTGTDPRIQGSDMDRQGGVDTDGTRRDPAPEGTGSETGGKQGGETDN